METPSYAKPVKRMSRLQKMYAEISAEKFGAEIGKTFDSIDNVGGYSAVFVDGDQYYDAEIVYCPHCHEITVCWGQYGDPETEICNCTSCGESFQCEPF
jgi:hypothetical protein